MLKFGWMKVVCLMVVGCVIVILMLSGEGYV